MRTSWYVAWFKHVDARSLFDPSTVQIDPVAPVPSWGLSHSGSCAGAGTRLGRLVAAAQAVASAERKALETAEPIAAALNVQLEVREAMHENDRSATGFLPPHEFESVANQFFAET